jgi:hypothetical protein
VLAIAFVPHERIGQRFLRGIVESEHTEVRVTVRGPVDPRAMVLTENKLGRVLTATGKSVAVPPQIL